MSPPASGAWTGQRATYVAVSAVSILCFALLTSVWHSDVSGTIALLGLLSVYMSSSELLVLFTVLAPVSIIVDIVRLTGHHPLWHGRWLLVLLSLAEMAAKAAGAMFGWSLHRSLSSGDAQYQPISISTGNNNSSQERTGLLSGHQPGGGPTTTYEAPAANSDPYAAFNPGREGNGTNTYQPFPTSTQHHL